MAGRPSAPRPSSRLVTRIAFGVIVAFVLLQAVWWVVFQRAYVDRVSDVRLADWRADARAAQVALDATEGDAELRERMLELQPHLTYEDGVVRVDPTVAGAFLAEQRGHRRMFAWEGPFFVLVVLSMLALIGRSLREERSLKRSQQNFLSAVTHEFKTPVATLRLLVQTAQMRDLPSEKRRDYLDRMASEIDRLERTSEHVLAAARLENAPVPVRLDAVDLRDVVARHVATMRPGLEARGARLRVETPDAPAPVSLDEDAFSIVLGNLLDNAVKYGPESGPKPVTVRLEPGRDVVALHVDDGGDGVPEAERERIFGRFYRAGDESTRRANGVGLGLHLVRSTVQAMNGWIRVGDAPEGGGRFTVVLPRRVGGEPAADAPREGRAGAAS